MQGNVIYQRTYPQSEHLDEAIPYCNEKIQFPKGSDLCKKILENTVQVLIPERVRLRETFCAIAKETADLYEMDIIITQYDTLITVDLGIDCYGKFSALKPLILMSDDISFERTHPTRHLTLQLTFYTHALYNSGRLIHPEYL